MHNLKRDTNGLVTVVTTVNNVWYSYVISSQTLETIKLKKTNAAAQCLCYL